jgi:hypothetical protein
MTILFFYKSKPRNGAKEIHSFCKKLSYMPSLSLSSLSLKDVSSTCLNLMYVPWSIFSSDRRERSLFDSVVKTFSCFSLFLRRIKFFLSSFPESNNCLSFFNSFSYSSYSFLAWYSTKPTRKTTKMARGTIRRKK